MEDREFKIPPAPTDIYKNRGSQANPAKEIWGKERPDGSGGSITFIPERFESIKGKGNFVYYYGVDLPSKTIAPVEAIYAMNPIKRRFINTIKLLSSKEIALPILGFLATPKKWRTAFLNKAVRYFNEEADTTALPYYLDDCYCPVVREIQNFVRVFLTELGIEENTATKAAEIVGMMFEYDNAYRFRIQDVLNEASKERLLTCFPIELTRLVELEQKRDRITAQLNNDVGAKFKKGALLLKLAWKSPGLRKKLRKALQAMDFNNCKLDEADIYHTLLYGDYDTRGLSLEERTAIYLSKYPDQSKAPLRILIRNKQ